MMGMFRHAVLLEGFIWKYSLGPPILSSLWVKDVLQPALELHQHHTVRDIGVERFFFRMAVEDRSCHVSCGCWQEFDLLANG